MPGEKQSAPIALSAFTAAVLLSSLIGCSLLGRISPLRPIERALLYQPDPYPEGDWQPDDMPDREVWFTADDGTRLHGWFLEHREPLGVALFIHGNGGNITSHLDALRMLNQQQRLAVLAFDYRGYGRSEGKPTERGILLDARAARQKLAEIAGIAESDVVLVGFSLGGGVAVDLAAKDGARGLVLMSTFTSLPNAAAVHVPWMMPRVNMTQRLDSLAKIKDYTGPLLISHGTDDQVIPYRHAEQLFEAAPGRKRLVTIDGGIHLTPDTPEYQAALRDYVASLPPSPRDAASR